MEQEFFLSGYCRRTDSSRMVTVVAEQGKILEIDCAYPDCPHAPNCQIAQKLCQACK